MKGWIMLHRSIQKHWIWQDPVKLKWWLDILLTVSHADNKVNVGMQLVDCKRGQCVMSLQNWAERWMVSRDTVRNFLTLLKNDTMITTENLTKSTRITVCNYDAYQNVLHAEQTQSKRYPSAKQTLSDTNNNYNNVNNIPPIVPLKGKRGSEATKKFKIPAIDEVEAYCRERKNTISGAAFVDFYTAKGWMVGKNKMKDWKAAVRTWEQKRKDETNETENTRYNIVTAPSE